MTDVPNPTAQPAITRAPRLYLFAFRIDPDVTAPELLTLFLYADVDRPLTFDDRILFFTKAELGELAVKQAGLHEQFPEPPRDVSLTCDVAAAMYLIAHGADDPDSVLLHCINTLLDMVVATQLAMPQEHRRVLHALADHLTFDHDLAGFFAAHGVPRIAAQDALLWSIGAITVRARVIG
jgi:hypothetical protein